jgi:Tfp pilus assembly protein PilV
MIEVMVAVLLTAIATTGIVGLYVVNTRASGFSRHTTEASVLAQDQMERLRTNGAVSGAPLIGVDESGRPGPCPSCIFDVSYVVSVGTAYADISVTVTWQEDGVTRTVTVLGRRNL